MARIGQYGSRDAGVIMPSRRDPMTQLASMLGIMAGDRYQPVPFAEQKAQELAALSPTSPPAKLPEQPVMETTTIAPESPNPSATPGTTRPPAARTTPTRRDDPRMPDRYQAIGTRILDAATHYLDIPYVYGGTNPRVGLDCSGFVQRVFADVGIVLPRVTYDQVRIGEAINDRSQLRPGDLIFFVGDRGQRANGHVGIYTGNGMMVDAPHTGARVGYRRVNWSRMTAMRRVTP